MRKLLVVFFVVSVFFFVPGAEGVRKTRKRNSPKHAVVVENIDKFRGFIAEFLFQQTAYKFYYDEESDTGKNSLFFEYLNDNRIAVEVLSNFRLDQEDVDDCLPILTLKNNEKRENNPTIIWDIRHMENRVMRFVAAKKVLAAIKQLSKSDKNLFEKHPYCCAGIGMLSTGVCCGVSGWLLHKWLTE